MKNIITNNLGLKLLALFLAIITWFYIVVELQKGVVEEVGVFQRIFPYRVLSKPIPIKLNLVGEPPKGYVVDYDNIAIVPSKFIMVGPKSFLKKISSAITQPIDISEHTKTVVKDVSITPPAPGIAIKDKFIKVTIPIIKPEN